MYEIKSTYVNPEGLVHTEVEQADTEEWCARKFLRQVDRFYDIIIGKDKQSEDRLIELKKYCEDNDRAFYIDSKENDFFNLVLDLSTGKYFPTYSACLMYSVIFASTFIKCISKVLQISQ